MYITISLQPILSHVLFFFFFTHTATTEIYTLSLHDALPIYVRGLHIYAWQDLYHRCLTVSWPVFFTALAIGFLLLNTFLDRKSTRLNSSHVEISYAVFCLKKKKTKYIVTCRYTSSLFLRLTQ